MSKPCLNSIELVREFHNAFNQTDRDEPHVDDDKVNALRLELLLEELKELGDALGFALCFDETRQPGQRAWFVRREDKQVDPVAALDALADLQYVLDGAYLQLGFADYKDNALAEVHRSNMSKLGEDGPIYRADGKIMKGPNYTPPNLASCIKFVRWMKDCAAKDAQSGGPPW